MNPTDEHYDLDHYINKFEAIDESLWITGEYIESTRHGLTGRCCALGHCGVRKCSNTKEGNDLLRICSVISYVNDDDKTHIKDTFWKASTPKERVLKYLRYLKEQKETNHA